MSYEFYKVLHVIGIVLLFASIGAQILHGMGGGTRDDHPARGLIMGSHGTALLVLLVTGFGMHAKLGFPPGLWFWVKLGIWLLLGGLIAVPLRRPELARPVFFALPVLGGLAAFMAIYKPF